MGDSGSTRLPWSLGLRGSQVVRQLEQEWKWLKMLIAQPWLCLLQAKPGLQSLLCSPQGPGGEGSGCWGFPRTGIFPLETPSSGSRRALSWSGESGGDWVGAGKARFSLEGNFL